MRLDAGDSTLDGWGQGGGALDDAMRSLALCAIRFGPRQEERRFRERPRFRSDEARSRVGHAPAASALPTAPLRASLPDPLKSSERDAQERILRDIASEWHGELRMDPIWSFLRRRLTVHSLGGCPMGSEPGNGFTEASGEVIGCPGLYVMDGAAFPTSVGVNPSATIAAVAEHKVETFIRERLSKSDWRAPDFEKALQWARDRREQLDPIGDRRESQNPPRHEPIGIRFAERMTGFHHAIPAGSPECLIEANLEVEIADLARFLELQRRGEVQAIPVKGEVRMQGIPELLPVIRGSCMRLFARGEGRETRTIVYELELEAPGRVYELLGQKIIRDDERFDVWEDATTLYFNLFEKGRAEPLRQGILRLSAADFFGKQIPSFEATNTDDPVRQSWALASFGRFFFSHLVDIYVPELDRIVDVVKSVAERTHV